MERVAIYDRSCTGDVSITVERLKSFAEQNGLIVTKIYKDEKYSGLNENRPAYRKMLSDAGLGKYDILLIRGVSRISRNITTFLKAKKSLEGKDENKMLTQFSRTELLLGKEAMEKLKNAKVAVFGRCYQ